MQYKNYNEYNNLETFFVKKTQKSCWLMPGEALLNMTK